MKYSNVFALFCLIGGAFALKERADDLDMSDKCKKELEVFSKCSAFSSTDYATDIEAYCKKFDKDCDVVTKYDSVLKSDCTGTSLVEQTGYLSVLTVRTYYTMFCYTNENGKNCPVADLVFLSPEEFKEKHGYDIKDLDSAVGESKFVSETCDSKNCKKGWDDYVLVAKKMAEVTNATLAGSGVSGSGSGTTETTVLDLNEADICKSGLAAKYEGKGGNDDKDDGAMTNKVSGFLFTIALLLSLFLL